MRRFGDSSGEGTFPGLGWVLASLTCQTELIGRYTQRFEATTECHGNRVNEMVKRWASRLVDAWVRHARVHTYVHGWREREREREI